ncbi:MAG: hypothetical protein U5L72_17630 [Bacteroidales bacterium]|nr:hypothetical protein [Bacteroidales bacterium]MDZ7636154.1 hypothetical protein [Bacteroidales bacterium]
MRVKADNSGADKQAGIDGTVPEGCGSKLTTARLTDRLALTALIRKDAGQS